MDEAWAPALSIRAIGSRCRLVLAGVTYGEGSTLQQAADDLVVRLGELALSCRSCGFPVSTELPPPDVRLLSFLWEIAERRERGEDIRDRVFGPSASPDAAL